MATDPFRIDVEGHVATVTIDRPDKGNALTLALWRTLGDRMEAAAAADPAPRVIILRGSGDKVFSAGADMSEFLAGASDDTRDYAAVFDDALARITHLPVPVIAQINGTALGGGCQLALACDLRVASDRATLGIPATRLGLVIPPQAHLRLITAVGVQRAREIMFFGRRYTAADARAIGLVDRVVPHDRLAAETRALAEEIAANAPLAVRAAKAAINACVDRAAWNPDAAPDAERLAQLETLARRVLASEDTQIGLAAFFARETPEFKGR